MERKLIPQVNRYLFNKKESIVIKPERFSTHGFTSQYEQTKVVAVMLCNLHELGYTIPHNEIPKLFNMSPDELNELIYQPLLAEAREAKGAHVEHRILFPGFPETARTLDIDTLSDIRFMSYFTTVVDQFVGLDTLSDGSITREFVEGAVKRAMDDAATKSRQPSWSHAFSGVGNDKDFYKIASSLCQDSRNDIEGGNASQPRAIHLVDDKEYFNMVRNMLSARTSLSPYDKEIVKFTIDNFDKEKYMPDKVRFRETQAMLDDYNFKKGYVRNIDVKTIKDFERLLVSLSGGDISSSKKQHVRNFSNQERGQLFKIFNNAISSNWPTMIESAASRRSLRFMDNVLENRLHFNKMTFVDDNGLRFTGTYNHFVKSAKAHERVMTAYERNMLEHKYDVAANILAKHAPKLFIDHARNIIGRAYADTSRPMSDKDRTKINRIMKTLAECAKKTDVSALLSLQKEVMRDRRPYKIMFDKGPRLDVVVKENKSIEIPVEARANIMLAIQTGIGHQIKKQEMSGKVQISAGTKVYIDPDLASCPIPTVGRNDTGKNRTVAAGTKLPVEKGEILRAALYKQNDKNQFIDFSCGFLDENYQLVGQTSWNNLQQRSGGKTVSYHSGDTMACSGKGCTEIIDIDLEAAKQHFPQARYVVYTALMWESNPLSSCNQLFMTLAPTTEMGKEDGQPIGKGYSKVYDPANVQFKVDITGDGFMSIPMLYDIETGKVMIVNIDTKIKDLRTFASNPRHFDLPHGCECLENYSTDLAIKCFAYSQLDVPTIHDLAALYAVNKEAEIVQTPGEADVVFATDRIQVDDKRPCQEGEELTEQVVVTPFDKDIITAELIPDPKAVQETQEQKEMRQQYQEGVQDIDIVDFKR